MCHEPTFRSPSISMTRMEALRVVLGLRLNKRPEPTSTEVIDQKRCRQRVGQRFPVQSGISPHFRLSSGPSKPNGEYRMTIIPLSIVSRIAIPITGSNWFWWVGLFCLIALVVIVISRRCPMCGSYFSFSSTGYGRKEERAGSWGSRYTTLCYEYRCSKCGHTAWIEQSSRRRR